MARKRPANPLDARDPVAVIGVRLRAWREKRGMTQVELARAAGGMTQVSVSMYELGKRTMLVTFALRLARALDLTLDAMLTTEP